MNAKGIKYLAALASFAAAVSANAADTTQTKQTAAQADKTAAANVSAPVRKASEEKSRKADKQYAAFWSQLTRESGS